MRKIIILFLISCLFPTVTDIDGNGDINGDGDINIVDIVALVSIILDN